MTQTTHTAGPPSAAGEIWCAIPVYNNAATIADVARRARNQLERVIVVDDGSTDADLRELLKPLDVAVVRHPKNLGKGAALLTAAGYAAERGGKYLITLDGDGQHFPEDIPRFLPLLLPDTILIGRRQEITGVMPQSSLFGREFSDFWVHVETGVHASDTQSGFRVYPLPAMLDLRLATRHYNFEVEAITRALWAGLCVGAVPIRVWYPAAAERVSSFHPVRDNARLSLLHTRLAVRQLFPLPHPRSAAAGRARSRRPGEFLMGSTAPLGLALAVALGILPGMLLWPWSAIAVLYIAWRLHLNKFTTLAGLALASPPMLPVVAAKAGRYLLADRLGPGLAWFVGAHVVGLPVALALACLVCAVARKYQASPAGTRSGHEHR